MPPADPASVRPVLTMRGVSKSYGERKVLDGAGQASYVAIYEIDSPAVLLSKEWAEAGEKGRWPKEVRPFTSNRRHIVRKVI